MSVIDKADGLAQPSARPAVCGALGSTGANCGADTEEPPYAQNTN